MRQKHEQTNSKQSSKQPEGSKNIAEAIETDNLEFFSKQIPKKLNNETFIHYLEQALAYGSKDIIIYLSNYSLSKKITSDDCTNITNLVGRDYALLVNDELNVQQNFVNKIGKSNTIIRDAIQGKLHLKQSTSFSRKNIQYSAANANMKDLIAFIGSSNKSAALHYALVNKRVRVIEYITKNHPETIPSSYVGR